MPEHKGKSESNKLSPLDKERVLFAANILPAYANFLRWTTNFPKESVSIHPNHNNVILLSPMLSGRFCFTVANDSLILGVQDFEMAWIRAMPFHCAYLSDRLYLSNLGAPCMNFFIPSLAIGIFVDSKEKIKDMANAVHLQVLKVDIKDGCVDKTAAHTNPMKIPIHKTDIIKELLAMEKSKMKKQDISRFF